MFRVETANGMILAELEEEQNAVLEARQRLTDDPELGEIYVASENEYLWKATIAPDWNWNSIVVVVPFDVKITTPGGAIGIDQHTDFLDAYADNAAKRERMLREGGML